MPQPSNLLVGRQFDKLFDTFQFTAFRFEPEQRYGVDAEDDPLARYLAGEERGDFPAMNAWIAMISAATAAGKHVSRVRVVELPMNPYTRFECAWCYGYSVPAGEGVHILPVPQGSWPVELPRQEFWLFDSCRRYDMHFGPDGSFLGAEQITDPAQIVLANVVRDIALQMAMPFTRFAAGYNERFEELPT